MYFLVLINGYTMHAINMYILFLVFTSTMLIIFIHAYPSVFSLAISTNSSYTSYESQEAGKLAGFFEAWDGHRTRSSQQGEC